jgi:hypothetical protein
MIQPATLIEREAAGDKKFSTYFNCDVLKLHLLLMMLRQKIMLLLLLLLMLQLEGYRRGESSLHFNN